MEEVAGVAERAGGGRGAVEAAGHRPADALALRGCDSEIVAEEAEGGFEAGDAVGDVAGFAHAGSIENVVAGVAIQLIVRADVEGSEVGDPVFLDVTAGVGRITVGERNIPGVVVIVLIGKGQVQVL